MSGHCPEDLVSEIFRHLSAKSLIRFKSASKSWCALFESPRFIRDHLSINRKHSRLLVNHQPFYDSDATEKKLFLDETLKDTSFKPINPAEIFLPGEPAPYFLDHDMGSFYVYDGVFCYLDYRSKKVVLANMATRELRCLPRLPKPQGVRKRRSVVVLALGFQPDLSSHDYKVFLSWDICVDKTKFYVRTSDGVVQSAIYFSSTDSWREVDSTKLGHFDDSDPDRFSERTFHDDLIDGVYYWVWFRYSGNQVMVLTFDLDGEVFEERQGLPTSDSGEMIPLSLAVFKHQSSVCLAVSYGDDRSVPDPLFYYIWAMNQDGSWCKQLKIGPLDGIRDILRLWKNGWAFLVSVNRELLLCDPSADENVTTLELKLAMIIVATLRSSLMWRVLLKLDYHRIRCDQELGSCSMSSIFLLLFVFGITYMP